MECNKCGRKRIHHNGMWLCKKCIPEIREETSNKTKIGPFYCRKCEKKSAYQMNHEDLQKTC
jgi:ribosomal protein L37AE/L43A